MHGWLIVPFSGFDADRVGALPVRLPTVLAVAGTPALVHAIARLVQGVSPA